MIATIQLGIPVARIELLDDVQMDAVNKLFEARATRSRRRCSSSSTARQRGVAEQAETVQAIAAEHGGDDFHWATTPRGPLEAVAGAARRLLRRARAAARREGLGDRRLRADLAAGRVHRRDEEGSGAVRRSRRRSSAMSATAISTSIFMIDPATPEEIAEASAPQRPPGRCARWRWTAPAPASTASAAARWTSSIAEHGEAVDVMRSIKQALDPDNIMNPGKIVRV